MNNDVLQRRIRMPQLLDKLTTAESAAALVNAGMTIGTSGFTLAGSAKVVPRAIANRPDAKDLKLTLLTGASLGNDVDTLMTTSGALAKRSPFQTSRIVAMSFCEPRSW